MNKDFDKENTLDKMRNLREQRDLELLDKESKDGNLDSENKVLNVKYLGTINKGNEQEEIYLIIEQKQERDGSIEKIERYCTKDGEILGGNNTSDQYNYIMLNQKYLNDDELLNQLNGLEKEGGLDLNELEQQRLEEIVKSLGISIEELEKISEIDADKEIADKDKEGEKIRAKQEIDINQKVTDNETIASLLNIQGKGYKKIAIIYSNQMKENRDNTMFSFVGIKADGTAEKIDTIEQAYGGSPSKTVKTLNKDGSRIEEQKVNSIFKIRGKTEEQIAIDIGSMGTIEPYFVRTPTQDNTETISIPIETSSIKPTTREVREMMNRSKNVSVKEEIARIEGHMGEGCNFGIKDINDNPYDDTHTHTHSEIDKNNLDDYASEILKNEDIAAVYDNDDVIENLQEGIEENEGIDSGELIEKVEENMKENAKKQMEDDDDELEI